MLYHIYAACATVWRRIPYILFLWKREAGFLFAQKSRDKTVQNRESCWRKMRWFFRKQHWFLPVFPPISERSCFAQRSSGAICRILLLLSIFKKCFENYRKNQGFLSLLMRGANLHNRKGRVSCAKAFEASCFGAFCFHRGKRTEICRYYAVSRNCSQVHRNHLHELIEKIVVHAPDKSSGHREQQIDIYYRFDVAVSTAVTKRTDYDKRRKAAQGLSTQPFNHSINFFTTATLNSRSLFLSFYSSNGFKTDITWLLRMAKAFSDSSADWPVTP